MSDERRSTQAGTIVLAALLTYFVVYLTGAYTGDDTLQFAADVLFGLIAVLLGLTLVYETGPALSPVGISGVALVVGGLAFLGWVATGIGILGGLGTLFVVAGIVGYLYAVWTER